ncbi:hypothetical protein [Nocardia pulmonis]|nr:hypothetical protein [Nocardia pulmonis]
MRSELQGETEGWPVAPQRDPSAAEQDASVIDLAALRRRRAGDDAPAAGIRRKAKPRRIGPDAP